MSETIKSIMSNNYVKLTRYDDDTKVEVIVADKVEGTIACAVVLKEELLKALTLIDSDRD
jgi:hypothetical protein